MHLYHSLTVNRQKLPTLAMSSVAWWVAVCTLAMLSVTWWMAVCTLAMLRVIWCVCWGVGPN